MNKTIISAIILLFAARFGYASGPDSYRGRVIDRENRPVQYATVALLDSAGTVIAGATSAGDGTFIVNSGNNPVPAGELELLCSFVGYKDFRSALAEMAAGEENGVCILRDAVLEEAHDAISGAVVSGKRELIEYNFDKIVLNVSELAVAQTGNALDVLKSSPGVTVDKDGNVKLNGQTVAIWIDGRPSSMSGKDLEVYLKGSPGNTIEKVELMSSPSAKYDAEGSGGIINIKTRKGFMQGLSGSVSLNGSIGPQPKSDFRKVNLSSDLSANLMYKTDKTLTSFSYSPRIGNMSGEAVENKFYGTDYSSLQYSHSLLDYFGDGHNVRLQNDWNITSKDVFGVIANASVSSSRTGCGSGNVIRNYLSWGTPDQKLHSEMLSDNTSDEKRDFVYANLNYTHTFDESRSAELTVNADYSRNAGREVTGQLNTMNVGDPSGNYGFVENTDRVLDLVSLKADYSTMLWKSTGRVEAGMKGALSMTDNKFAHNDYDTSAEPWQLSELPSSRDDFKYSEQIYAAYVNVAKRFGMKWNVQAGIRGEGTVSKGRWQNSSDTRNAYFDVFPNISVSWIPSQKLILSANYSYRISRPKYWQLNPFVSYINATTYTQGKADLAPAYSHNATLTAVLFSRVSVNAGYGSVRNYNDIQVPHFDMENGMMGHIYENAGVQQNAYVSVALSELPLTKWWNLTMQGRYIYEHFRAYPGLETGLGDGYVNQGHAFYCYAATTFYLPANFKTGLSGLYCTPQLAGFYDVDSMWSVNFDFSKSFLDSRLVLSFYVNDIFNSMHQTLKVYDGDRLSYCIENVDYTRSFRFGLTWRFGKAVKSSRKVGTLDESSRM